MLHRLAGASDRFRCKIRQILLWPVVGALCCSRHQTRTQASGVLLGLVRGLWQRDERPTEREAPWQAAHHVRGNAALRAWQYAALGSTSSGVATAWSWRSSSGYRTPAPALSGRAPHAARRTSTRSTSWQIRMAAAARWCAARRSAYVLAGARRSRPAPRIRRPARSRAPESWSSPRW